MQMRRTEVRRYTIADFPFRDAVAYGSDDACAVGAWDRVLFGSGVEALDEEEVAVL